MHPCQHTGVVCDKETDFGSWSTESDETFEAARDCVLQYIYVLVLWKETAFGVVCTFERNF